MAFLVKLQCGRHVLNLRFTVSKIACQISFFLLSSSIVIHQSCSHRPSHHCPHAVYVHSLHCFSHCLNLVISASNIQSLKTYMMKPYSLRNLTLQQRIFQSLQTNLSITSNDNMKEVWTAYATISDASNILKNSAQRVKALEMLVETTVSRSQPPPCEIIQRNSMGGVPRHILWLRCHLTY